MLVSVSKAATFLSRTEARITSQSAVLPRVNSPINRHNLPRLNRAFVSPRLSAISYTGGGSGGSERR